MAKPICGRNTWGQAASEWSWCKVWVHNIDNSFSFANAAHMFLQQFVFCWIILNLYSNSLTINVNIRLINFQWIKYKVAPFNHSYLENTAFLFSIPKWVTSHISMSFSIVTLLHFSAVFHLSQLFVFCSPIGFLGTNCFPSTFHVLVYLLTFFGTDLEQIHTCTFTHHLSRKNEIAVCPKCTYLFSFVEGGMLTKKLSYLWMISVY